MARIPAGQAMLFEAKPFAGSDASACTTAGAVATEQSANSVYVLSSGTN
jgi:hypothetical protein